MHYFYKILLIILLNISLFLSIAKADTLTEFEQQLAEYKGKVVYLDFWASWCIPCLRSFPWMNEIQQKYSNEDFAVFSVNLDADKSFATAFLEKTPANFPVFYDLKGKVAKAFKLRGMPSSYIIDRTGKIVSSHVGFNDEKKVAYQTEIEKLIHK
ncbi:TlpA disulfide reductase family protein [Thalassotalea profundi]|uniref:Thioredoxin domain-containing protein n=1 Tax=Thalassotalea profundi TaxID=2036687 RepID=A0ABQ3J4H2_9GAMM|nr:TlpA disulfide reductase family protein [Thalassotalea profundi]GHF00078.1 hypothetical protein GCM10011501_31900 [Thalassotalea profundi]